MYKYQEQLVEETQKRKEIQTEYQMQVDFLQREKEKIKKQVQDQLLKTSHVVEVNNGREFGDLMLKGPS